MEQTLYSAALVCWLAVCVSGPQHAGEAGTFMREEVYHVYELYSWRDASGGWNFSMFSGALSSERTVKQVFDKRQVVRGLDQLKRTISTLPQGSKILLAGRLPSNPRFPRFKGSERLRYPPPQILAEMRRYAESRSIQVLGRGGCTLYSWQDAHGHWNFGFLNEYSRKGIEELFSKDTLRGVAEVKRKISELAPGSSISWFTQLSSDVAAMLSGAEGSDRFRAPPAEIAEEIRRYAEAREIEVIGP